MIHSRTNEFGIGPDTESKSNGNRHIGAQEVRRYYYKLIVQEFRDLQLDENLKNKSVFDLIDYCESLYEKSAESVNGDKDSLKFYIRGFLIFNYFINSFIMLHFEGFDQFIKTNEYDFIIYLNVFAFYNTDDMIENRSLSLPLPELRSLILDFLEDRQLLKFDVNELYQWLHEYIEYLKKKDQFQKEASQETDASHGSEDVQEITREQYSEEMKKGHQPQLEAEEDYDSDDSNIYTGTIGRSVKSYDLSSRLETLNMNNSDDSITFHADSPIENFNDRFPSIKLRPGPVTFERSTDNLTADNERSTPQPSKEASASSNNIMSSRPPIPSQPPPGLPLANGNKSTPQYPISTKLATGKSDSEAIPYPVDKDIQVEETPYPLGALGSTDDISFNNGSFAKPPLNTARTEPSLKSYQSYEREKQMAPPATYRQASADMVPKLPSRMSLPGPVSNSVPVQNMPHLHSTYGQYGNQFVGGPPPMMTGPVPPVSNGPYNGQFNGQYNGNYYPNGGPAYYQQPYGPNMQQQQYQQQMAQQQMMNDDYARQKQMRMKYMQDLSICGLKNFGSSCYVNSTIQLLFGVDELKALFSHSKYNKFIRDPKFVAAKKNPQKNSKDNVLLSEAVSGLLKSFTMHGGASIAPTKFIRISSLLKPDLNIPYEQQDSQEFLLFVLDRLHEELSSKNTTEEELNVLVFESYMRMWGINIPTEDLEGYFKWYKSLIEFEGSSPIHDLVEGHLQSKLICNKCRHQSINYSQFTILSLPIPSRSRYGGTGPIDLSDCLRYYTQDEVLSGENAWKCPKCHKASHEDDSVGALDNHPVFTKKPGIFKLSRRSKSPVKKDKKDKSKQAPAVQMGSSVKKLNFIKLPRILFIHLSRFSMFNLTDKLDTVISYPLELKFNNYSNDCVITYRLSGLINHYGNLKSGHYTSLVNKSTKGDSSPYWCYFDDESVRLNVNHINQSFNASSRDVYVLCYERI